MLGVSLVGFGGQSKIFFGDAAFCVAAEIDAYLIVNIVPVWMVVHFLGLYGDGGHERKGLCKIDKGEYSVQKIAFLGPAWNELSYLFFDLRLIEGLHGVKLGVIWVNCLRCLKAVLGGRDSQLFVPKPAIGSLAFIFFKHCVDGLTVLNLLLKLLPQYEIKHPHI